MLITIRKAVCLVILSSLVITCASTPEGYSKRGSGQTKVLDDKGMAFGIAPPKWLEYAVAGTTSKISGLYPKKVAFVQQETGGNKKLLEMKGNTTGVNAQFASVVATAIVNNYKSVADAEGEDFNTEAYRNTIEGGAKAGFSGLVKEGDWWVYVEDSTGKKEYRYYFLYLIDEDLFAEQVIALAKDSSEKLDNPELAEAVERDVDSTIDLFKKVQE